MSLLNEMLAPLLLLLSSSVFTQTTIDPDVLINIFGKPSTARPPPGPTTPRLEDITVKTTDKTTTFLDKNGDACQCVPYYLCDSDLNAIHADNSSVTGFGTLDIRFRADDCQESTERCCKSPKREEDVVTPAPPVVRGCGFRNKGGLDFTIYGGAGNEAGFGEYPWVVAVLDAYNDSYAGVGVLIHPQVVLTGAHIVYKYLPGTLKIRAGEWDTQTVKERLKYQERNVEDIYMHNEFNPKNLKNDMALLKLSTPVMMAEHINVICLPEQDESFDSYKNCVANGWGKDVFGKQGSYAVILKKIEQDMVGHARCNMLLKRTRLGNNFKLHRSFVCAGGEEGKDTCQGDGGAPLVCPIGNDRYKLTGLVAWGIGCGQKDVPAVYASVSAFRNWINDKMSQWGLTLERI